MRHEPPDCTRRGQAQVSVDIHLANAVLNALNHLLYGYTVGLGNLAAKFIDDSQPVLRNRRGAVHHQMGVGNARVDVFDAIDGENVAGRWARELVGPVAGTAGDRQCVDAGVSYKPSGLLGIGQHLVVGQFTRRANAVFFASFTGLKRAQAADFTLYRDTAGVSHFHHSASDARVVVVVHRRFAILAQGAIHHHRAETELNRPLTDGR